MNEYAGILRQTYPFKTEMHTHSSGVSFCASVTPEQLVRYYKCEGYDAIVLTNHAYFENAKTSEGPKVLAKQLFDEWEKAKKEGERVGLRVYFGAEIRFRGSINDYLFYGADREFFENLTLEDMASLENFSKVRGEDTLLIQAHPFRKGMTLASEEYIDGIEAFNVHTVHNARVGFAAKYAEEMDFLCTCGTDYHDMGNGALSALRTRTLPKDERELAAMIKSGDVAWQIGKAVLVF